MIGLMYSSLVISKHIFTFLRLDGAMNARTIHLLCAYWGLVMMSVHLGMHISQIAARIKLKSSKFRLSMQIAFGAIAVLGIYEFIKLKFVDYMFGKVQFVFIDTSASAVITVLQYACVVVLFAEVGYYLNRIISKTKKLNK